MSDQPLVTVGIPTYNRPAGLRATLDCITNQTYRNLQIIVADNCSEDENVRRIGEEFAKNDSRITYYRHDRNTGAYNFQFILGKAEGEYFMWAADDDGRTLTIVEDLISVIKNRSAAFSNYAVRYEQSGKVDHISIESSLAGNNKFEQAKSFLQRRIPSLIYGLYRTNDIKWFVETGELFDWFDCYLILKTILLYDGFAFSPKELFTAGVKGETYEYKPRKPTNKRIFSYTPYFVHSFKLIFQSNITLAQKFKLLRSLTDVNFRSFLLTEKVRKNYWFYSFLFKIYSRLMSPLNSNKQ
jgi:glycosyltransferase involved in cell wall biosynthesis